MNVHGVEQQKVDEKPTQHCLETQLLYMTLSLFACRVRCRRLIFEVRLIIGVWLVFELRLKAEMRLHLLNTSGYYSTLIWLCLRKAKICGINKTLVASWLHLLTMVGGQPWTSRYLEIKRLLPASKAGSSRVKIITDRQFPHRHSAQFRTPPSPTQNRINTTQEYFENCTVRNILVFCFSPIYASCKQIAKT